MVKKHPEPEKHVQFYNFWFWQYTCRNEEYISAYEKYKNDPIPDKILEIAYQVFSYDFNEKTARMLLDAADYENPKYKHKLLDELKLELNLKSFSNIYDFRERAKNWLNERRRPFDKIYKCSPKNPEEDCDSEKILVEAFNNTLDKQIKELNLKLFEEDIIQECELPTQFNYFVDTEKKSKNGVIAEVTYWYKQHSANNAKERNKAKFEFDSVIIENSRKGFKIDDEIRAVGLWLWDHKKNMEVNKSKYSIAQTTRDLYERHSEKLKGLGKISKTDTSNENSQTTYRVLRRFYNTADNSIIKRQVLPTNPSK